MGHRKRNRDYSGQHAISLTARNHTVVYRLHTDQKECSISNIKA